MERMSVAEELLKGADVLPVLQDGQSSNWITKAYRHGKRWPAHWMRSYWCPADKTLRVFVVKWKGNTAEVEKTFTLDASEV